MLGETLWFKEKIDSRGVVERGLGNSRSGRLYHGTIY